MSTKSLHFSTDGRAALKRGVDQLADAVKVTLGPRGRNVVIDKKYGTPTITKDGVTVAKEIELSDPIENMGAQMVKRGRDEDLGCRRRWHHVRDGPGAGNLPPGTQERHLGRQPDGAQARIALEDKSNKKRKDWRTPVTKALLGELRAFQRELGAVGGLMFASEHDPEVPMDRDSFTKLLVKAGRRAGLQKLDGGLWHPYRRKWATERKHLALADVAEAGGWLSTVTLATCYQQPTNDMLVAVMSEARKVRDVAVIDRA